jgi:hypothetical protein
VAFPGAAGFQLGMHPVPGAGLRGPVPGGLRDAGTVVVIPTVPTVTTISPTQSPTTGETLVTITGASLDEVTTVVNFGPNLATNLFLNAADTQLRVTSPGGVGTVPVTVTAPGGTSNALDFTYQQSPICRETAATSPSGRTRLRRRSSRRGRRCPLVTVSNCPAMCW